MASYALQLSWIPLNNILSCEGWSAECTQPIQSNNTTGFTVQHIVDLVWAAGVFVCYSDSTQYKSGSANIAEGWVCRSMGLQCKCAQHGRVWSSWAWLQRKYITSLPFIFILFNTLLFKFKRFTVFLPEVFSFNMEQVISYFIGQMFILNYRCWALQNKSKALHQLY